MSQVHASSIELTTLILLGSDRLDVEVFKGVFATCNHLFARDLFKIAHLSNDEINLVCAGRQEEALNPVSGQSASFDKIVVFCGAELPECRTLDAWIRRRWRRGSKLYGVSGGVFLLARAGVLAGHRCTTHWRWCNKLAEQYKDIQVTSRVIEEDGRIVTCGGGLSCTDLALSIIDAELGGGVAGDVSEYLVHERRGEVAEQRRELRDRLGTDNRAVLRAVEVMMENIEDVVPRSTIAMHSGVSIRQLERLFRTKLNTTLGGYYRLVRLRHAYDLITATSDSITDIGLACGFKTPSHFAKSFREIFGRSPLMTRQQWRGGNGRQLE